MPTVEPPAHPAHSSLAIRLTLAFVGVSLLAVLIVTGIATVEGGKGIDRMVADRRADLIRSLRANAAATYLSGGAGWSRAEWEPALDLAVRNGTDVAVVDRGNDVVVATAENPVGLPGEKRFPIVIDDKTVGTLVVAFTGRDSAGGLRRSLITAVLSAACLAAVLAAAVALAVSRRLTAPLTLLIHAAESMGRGVTDVRVGPVRQAPREFRDLAATFDTMADNLVREEQLRRDLVADVAHELRTPVAILQAHLEALADGVISYTPQEIQSLHEEVVRLGERVGDLQELSRADAAVLTMCPRYCDLAQLTAAAILQQLRARSGNTGMDVTWDLEPVAVYADPGRLHQVVTNLLVNALKFTPPGGSVHVAVGAGHGAGRVVIRDSGIGIAPADLPHVFDRFWRSPEVTHIAGSGIGLTIVARLVRAHGGTVHIDSTRGEGTTVTVTLPLAGRRADRGTDMDLWPGELVGRGPQNETGRWATE